VSQSGSERCVKNDICDIYVVHIPYNNQMNTILIPTNVQQYCDVVLLQVMFQFVSGHLRGCINKNSLNNYRSGRPTPPLEMII
jgi:hypothetical protein